MKIVNLGCDRHTICKVSVFLIGKGFKYGYFDVPLMMYLI